jgi:hypothetical protein
MARKKIIVIGKQRKQLDADLMVQVVIALGKELMRKAAEQEAAQDGAASRKRPTRQGDDSGEAS